MKIINEDLFMVVIDEKDDKAYFYRWQELVSLIYENSKTFRRFPTYESQLFNNKYHLISYHSISQEAIIKSIFDTIESMKDQEECEFNVFDEYKFKIKVIRLK